MTSPRPLTGEDLAEIKRRLDLVKVGTEFWCPDKSAEEFFLYSRRDMARLVAEVVRLRKWEVESDDVKECDRAAQ